MQFFEAIGNIVGGMIISALIVLTIFSLATCSDEKTRLNACESTLPRDQNCVLKAVPESKESKP